MANRQRNIQLKIWVNEEERKLIEQKMAQLPTSQLGAYMRKMAIDGYIIYTDIKNIKQYIRELQTIGKNITRYVNTVVCILHTQQNCVSYVVVALTSSSFVLLFEESQLSAGSTYSFDCAANVVTGEMLKSIHTARNADKIDFVLFFNFI